LLILNKILQTISQTKESTAAVSLSQRAQLAQAAVFALKHIIGMIKFSAVSLTVPKLLVLFPRVSIFGVVPAKTAFSGMVETAKETAQPSLMREGTRMY
jgi:hypothetical protein